MNSSINLLKKKKKSVPNFLYQWPVWHYQYGYYSVHLKKKKKKGLDEKLNIWKHNIILWLKHHLFLTNFSSPTDGYC